MDRFLSKLFLVVFFGFLVLFFNQKVFAQQALSCESTDPSWFTFHANKQIDDRLKLADTETGLDLYTNRSDILGNSWTRNPNSWTQKGVPLDFTGVAGWNNHLANQYSNVFQRGATLISPRHFITANHFKINPGSIIQFFDKDGNSVSRKVIDTRTILSTDKVDSVFLNTDINVGLLESDVDSSITHYPLLSYKMTHDYIPRINRENPYNIPLVILNQFGQTFLRQLDNDDENGIYNKDYKNNTTDSSKEDFEGDIVEGDSGQPVFLIVNNQPILLSTHTHPHDGENLGYWIPSINSAIESMGNSNGYKVEEYDLSNFIKQSSDCVPPKIKFKIDDQVVIKNKTPIYDNYGFDSVFLGSLSVGKLGKIGDGPYYSDGLVWWGVEYDSGEVGYSPETGLVKYEPDTKAPTIPSGLSISSAKINKVTLSWNSSTDDIGIEGYRVYRCVGQSCTSFSEIGIASTTTYSDETVSEKTIYRYVVAAYDGNLNQSSLSISVGTTTPVNSIISPKVNLTVYKFGVGGGTILGPGINCRTVCVKSVDNGTSITIEAFAADDSFFTGWTNGPCVGTGKCTLLMNSSKSVSANFALKRLKGECGSVLNSCKVGFFVDTVDSTTTNIWTCGGSNGGDASACFMDKLPVNGLVASEIINHVDEVPVVSSDEPKQISDDHATEFAEIEQSVLNEDVLPQLESKPLILKAFDMIIIEFSVFLKKLWLLVF